MTMENFIDEKTKLTNKFGGVPKDQDVVWSLFNVKIKELIDKPDQNTPNILKSLYHTMAYFLVTVESKDPSDLLKQAHRIELKKIYDVGIYPKVRICTFHEGVCDTAKQLKNKIFNLSDILDSDLLPPSNCKNMTLNKRIAWCTCTYFALTEDEVL